jgi:hypothetical protein
MHYMYTCGYTTGTGRNRPSNGWYHARGGVGYL